MAMLRALPITLTLAGLMICANYSLAGPVSLTDAQRQKLIQLVNSDAEAAQRFADIKRGGEPALKAEPNPLQYIGREGKLRNDPERIKTDKSTPDLRRMSALGFAYAVMGEASYATKARQFLAAW